MAGILKPDGPQDNARDITDELVGALRSVADGRQSDTAARIARGVRRYLRAAHYATLPELPLPSGRRADLVGLGPDGTLLIVEVKSSLADFRADRKWSEYRAHCDRLYFAVDLPALIDVLPPDAGVLLADGFGAEVVRTPAEHRLAPATRRAMLLRFARAAADRLHHLGDPDQTASLRGR